VAEVDDPRALAARLRAAADAERRGIERDLHDGVQQDLVALSVNLQLARKLADSDPGAAAALLDDVQRDVHEALDAVRALAQRVYPPILPVRGLAEALRTIPAPVQATAVGRYPLEVEETVYFCCVELVSHASEGVSIRLWQEAETLCFAIAVEPVDDGGLAVVRDRLAAFGGFLTTSSGDTRGTIPL